jgi:hypothetical protein
MISVQPKDSSKLRVRKDDLGEIAKIIFFLVFLGIYTGSWNRHKIIVFGSLLTKLFETTSAAESQSGGQGKKLFPSPSPSGSAYKIKFLNKIVLNLCV